MLAALGPKHDHPSDDQRRGHGNGIEQVVVNGIGENHAQHHGRHEGDQQVEGETLRLLLFGQTHDDVEDLAPKLPDYCQNRPQLNDDVEGHGALAAKIDQVGDDDLMPGTGDRQELRQPFYNTQYQRLSSGPKIHHSP